MKSEQWIRTQKKRVRKKYIKLGDMYLSPKDTRDFNHEKHFSVLRKAIKKINKMSQEDSGLSF